MNHQIWLFWVGNNPETKITSQKINKQRSNRRFRKLFIYFFCGRVYASTIWICSLENFDQKRRNKIKNVPQSSSVGNGWWWRALNKWGPHVPCHTSYCLILNPGIITHRRSTIMEAVNVLFYFDISLDFFFSISIFFLFASMFEFVSNFEVNPIYRHKSESNRQLDRFHLTPIDRRDLLRPPYAAKFWEV